MKILSFDTCFSKTYITLCENDKIIVSKSIESTDEGYHSVYLIPNIVKILNSQNLTIKQLDAIGVNIGPGSFTGIRISAVIARVFSQAANLKLVGVPSLQILSKINKTENNTTVILDARKNKVYFARYNNNSDVITEPRLIDVEKISESLCKNDVIITDNSISEHLQEAGVDGIRFEDNQEKIGEYLAELTYKKLKEGGDFNFALLKPMYIQPPSISMPKVKK